MDLDQAIAAHKADYLNHPRRTFQTYDKEYGSIFRRLPEGPLSADLLLQTLLAIPDDTRQRKRAARALQKLATFADIPCDLLKYGGTYSATKTQARNLPSDEAIAKFHETIQNSKWRWVHGAISTYGLRPHEALFLTINPDGTAQVTAGKTGPRKVWPFLPEWVYAFGLQSPRRPDITTEGRPFEKIGAQVSKYLRQKAQCPYLPYDLRHAWAVRVMDLGLKDALAAAQMGHSVEVHQRIYQHWISEREHAAAFQEILQNRSTRR